MTPSNPTNGQPFIYRIMDALGITHLVVAVQHSHLMSEIEGLVSALAGKSDTSHSHKIIQYNPSASTDGFAGFPITGNGDFIVGVQDNKKIIFQFEGMPKASVTKTNADNLARALQDPDTTPTANSDKLVTSGGVKAALAEKMDMMTVDNTPTKNSNNLVTSGGVKAAMDVQKRINNRQLILTKTANGYQFVNSESDLPTFVNMIKSWGGEEDFVCANCIVITDGDAVAMPAMFNWAESPSYITIRAFIGCYLLEGDIRKNGSSYSSDMMMQLEDRSYVFSE